MSTQGGGKPFTELDMWKGVKTKEQEYVLALILTEVKSGWLTWSKYLHLAEIFTNNFPIELAPPEKFTQGSMALPEGYGIVLDTDSVIKGDLIWCDLVKLYVKADEMFFGWSAEACGMVIRKLI